MTELELRAQQLAEEQRANKAQEDLKAEQNFQGLLSTKLKSRDTAVNERKQQLAEDVEAGNTAKSAADIALTQEKTKSEGTNRALSTAKTVEAYTKSASNVAKAFKDGTEGVGNIFELKNGVTAKNIIAALS